MIFFYYSRGHQGNIKQFVCLYPEAIHLHGACKLTMNFTNQIGTSSLSVRFEVFEIFNIGYARMNRVRILWNKNISNVNRI
jgi:hypothetical protein